MTDGKKQVGQKWRLIFRQYMNETKCTLAEYTVGWCMEMHALVFFRGNSAGTDRRDHTPLPHEQHATVNYCCSVAQPQGVIT